MLALKLDVTKPGEITRAVELATQKFKHIDVLVNNAGYGLLGALEECKMDDIRAAFDTNVFGVMEVTKAVLPYMRARKSGHILNMSSSAGVMSSPGLGIYNSTKFAIEGLSEALALDLAEFGIKVTLIEPGPFRTDFAGESIRISAFHPDYVNSKASEIREYFEKYHQHQPGDPIKAAQIMIKITTMENPPLRLPLGSIAVDRIAGKLTKQLESLRVFEEVSRSADFEMASAKNE